MADSIGTILSKGWDDLKANPVLIAPGVLTMLFTYIFIFALVLVLLTQFMSAGDLFMNSGGVDPAYFDSLNFDSVNIGLIVAVFLVAVILLILVSSFISAGLTGMAKEAVTTGKTSLSDLWAYGKKYFLKMLGLTIILGIIMAILGLIVGLILLIIFMIPMILFMSLGSMAGAIGFVLFYLLFLIVFIFAVILISAPFYFASYALVVDDYGIFESISKSWHLFMANKKEVLYFVIVIIFISFAVSLVLQALGFVLAFIPIVGIILLFLIEFILLSVMTALYAVWSVRKYYGLITEDVFEEPAAAYGEYSRIEQGILDSDGNVVSEEVYEETTTVWDDERRD